jgi:hypothetical protein
MSLINQALRKAQQDRTPQNTPASGPGEPAIGSPPASPKNRQPGVIIGLIALVALLIGLVGGLSAVLLKSGPTKPAAAADAAEASSTTASTPAAPTLPINPDTAPRTPLTEPSDNNPPKAEPAPAPRQSEPATEKTPDALIEELRLAGDAAEAKIHAEQKAAATAQAQTPKIIDWLTESRVTGIRLSPTQNKVILNGETYNEGEYVNPQLGLKVILIEETRVLFADDNGKKYKKRI